MDTERPQLDLIDGGKPDDAPGQSLENDCERIKLVGAERGPQAASIAAADLYMARRSFMGDDHPWVMGLREEAIARYQSFQQSTPAA